MESTREELMDMLAIEYIMLILVREWGPPKKDISLIILTDSETVKITRQDKEAPRLGAKRVIRPNIELKMELKIVEIEIKGVDRSVQWTKSHVSGETLENDYESRLNDLADKLAIKGRDRVIEGIKEAAKHHIYPGAIVTLKMGGSVVLNNVGKTTKKLAHKQNIKNYLMEKYDWNEKNFDTIN